MNISISENLPGLSPFNAAQQKSFFGRKRQVDDLLSLMQSGRFISVVGNAGSGKTSLIRAGLIPALELGFDGVAGKKWAIAYCRTGVTPIENLAAALAEENVLADGSKGSLELQEEIVREIRKDHSGLLRVAAQQESLHQKNLLIVLDQFEDIFKFDGLSKQRNEHWDLDISLLFNNLARAVAASRAPVYVMIGLRSSFLPRMYNYRSIQDHLNSGLYALPLLRQEDLKQVIQGSLKQHNILLSEEAFLFLENGYDQNAQNLPFVQLCLHRLVQKRIKANFSLLAEQEKKEKGVVQSLLIETQTVNIKDVAVWGDLSSGVAFDLEKFYQAQTSLDKKLMEQLFKLIALPVTEPEVQAYRTLKHIQEITEVRSAELKGFLMSLYRAVPNVLEFIQPYTHKSDYLHKDNLNDDTIINIGNTHLLQKWQQLSDWINEERESRESYLRLSERALLFEQGKAGCMVPPDLDLMIHWYFREAPKKVWADQFNGMYNLAIDYLMKSQQEHQLALERKETARKRELKRQKKYKLIWGVVAGAMLILSLYTWCKQKEANEEKIKATQEADRAEYERGKAQKAEKAALDSARAAQTQRLLALQQTKIANKERTIANEAMVMSNKNEQRAVKLAQALKIEIKRAETNQKKAENNADEANLQRSIALENAILANNSRDFIDSRSRIVALLNRLNSETYATLDARVAFVDSLLNNYVRYVNISQKLNGGKVIPFDNLYRLLTTVKWKILDNKPSLFNSDQNLYTAESGLRDIDMYENKLAVASGDDQRIVFFKPGEKPELYNTKFNQNRIRTVKFYNESSVLFTNVAGEIFLFNRNGKTPAERERKIARLEQDIISSLIVFNDQLITLNKGMLEKITINSGAREMLKAPKGILQLFELNDKQVILKTASELYLYDLKRETATALILPNNMPVGKVSSVAVSDKYSFWGSDAGQVFICSPLNGSKIQPYETFKPHKTKITSMLVDRESQQLITASMDNTANIYNISSDNFSSWEENVLILKGFRKWIWDLGLMKANGRTELLTVDEGGELLKWSTRMDDLYKDVLNWKQQNNKR